MKFSIKVQYGLQSMLELALDFGGAPVQIKEVADNQNVPIRFLEQLLLVLKRNGLVISNRGKNGGYALAKKPDEISVLNILEAFEGPVELAGKKMRKLPVLYETFKKVEEGIKNNLSAVTLEDLVLKKRQKDRAFTYSI